MTIPPPEPDPLDRLLNAAGPPTAGHAGLADACAAVARDAAATSRLRRLPTGRQTLVGATVAAALIVGVISAVLLSGPRPDGEDATIRPPVAASGWTTVSTSPAPLTDKSGVVVMVLNGSGRNGVASRLTPLIQRFGYETAPPANANSQGHRESFVAFTPGSADIAHNLAADLALRRFRPIESDEIPRGAGAIDVFVIVGDDALAERFGSPEAADRRTFDACAPDHGRTVLTLHPTDRTLPPDLTWARLAHAIARRHSVNCNSAPRPRVADDIRREFEFMATAAWDVAYVRAHDRGDAAAIERATRGIEAGVARPAVLRGHGDAPDVIERRLARAARAGDVATVRAHVDDVLKPRQNPWMAEIR